MKPVETERLRLRELEVEDAPFILGLLNEPSWIKYIGDRKIRDEAGAKTYINDGPRSLYASAGFGLWMVESRGDSTPMGICGLIRRDSLEDVDLGFAFKPAFWGQGMAYEASLKSIEIARELFSLERLVAISSPENTKSHRLLERLGFRQEGMIRPDGEDIDLVFHGRSLVDG